MNVFTLLSGLAMFLFGMDVMGGALKRSAGNRLKDILGRMTANPLKGFILGVGATAVMQSSSATTVMVVGFVNSGAMTLSQSIGVILGANMGAAITFWLTGLSGIGGAAGVTSVLQWLSPSTWTPILALIGIGIVMFVKRGKKRDIAYILLGFAVLMVGMDLMSGAVSGLRDNENFGQVMTLFENNPFLGLLAGTLLTAVIQSSGASVGILQSLTVTGAITFGMAIPIMMGQNIGTCITAMLSSIGATKNGRRAALAHLYFNLITGVAFTLLFWLSDLFFEIPLWGQTIGMWGVAGTQTILKAVGILCFIPLLKPLEKLAYVSVSDKDEEGDNSHLDTRLFATPTLAVDSAEQVARDMACLSCRSLRQSIDMLFDCDPKEADSLRAAEDRVDRYEDDLGSYLVQLSAVEMPPRDSHKVTMLLHIIGDLERISDHSVNVVESAEEMRDKRLSFSDEAREELATLTRAIGDILDITLQAFQNEDLALASQVEPLEQVVDDLKDQIRSNHIQRLQKNECSIEHGFVLNDLLTNFERVADHCSNIAGCLLEILQNDTMDMHRYLNQMNRGEAFEELYRQNREKYALKQAGKA